LKKLVMLIISVVIVFGGLASASVSKEKPEPFTIKRAYLSDSAWLDHWTPKNASVEFCGKKNKKLIVSVFVPFNKLKVKSPALKAFELSVNNNNSQVALLRVTREAIYSVEIDSNKLKSQKGMITLDLKSNATFIPKDSNESKDNRELSYNITKIVYE
jgi:hypothetical protein